MQKANFVGFLLSSIIGSIIFIGTTSASHAALVWYKIEGDLTATDYRRGDFSGLNGAHFERIMSFDVDANPTGTTFRAGSANLAYVAVSDVLRISERPDGFEDQAIDFTGIWYDSHTNYDVGVYDIFAPAYSSRENMTFMRKTASDVGQYPGDKLVIGNMPLLWLDGQNRFDGLVDGNKLLPLNLDYEYGYSDAWTSGTGQTYGVSNFSASVVPIPAAVWLFGSGLGLLGWLKRKADGTTIHAGAT